MKTTFTALLAVVSFSAGASASIFDDFNDGNDVGWSRQSPLGGFGAGAQFTFPGGNTYQIHAPVSPNAQLGPARGGSVRLDEIYTNFYQQVDIVDWDETRPSMAMGFLARAKEFGLGSTDGYVCVLEADGDFYITTTNNEAPTTPYLAQDLTLTLDPNADYRITFSGYDTSLSAQVYNLAAPTIPIATLNTFDFAATYTTGQSGVFIYDGSTGGTGTATATFDNYFSVPEPASFAIFAAGAVVLAARRRRVAGQ